jgi:hypothetical protein
VELKAHQGFNEFLITYFTYTKHLYLVNAMQYYTQQLLIIRQSGHRMARQIFNGATRKSANNFSDWVSIYCRESNTPFPSPKSVRLERSLILNSLLI